MVDLKKILTRFSIENVEQILRRRIFKVDASVLFLGLAIGVYTLTFSYFTIMKDLMFGTYAWDLGIFNQALWTTVKNGRLFYYTPELLINPSGIFFGIHFSPILFPILLFYAVLPASHTLLVLQSFILALGAVPLYKLSIAILKHRVAALVFVFVYLLYPPLQGINWFDFHVQAFLPLFLFCTMYFFKKKSWKAYFLFTVSSLMVEEHASMIVMFIGIYGFIINKERLLSILRNRDFKCADFLVPAVTFVLATLWYLMTLWVRDTFFPINPDFLFEFKAAANWSILGVQDPLLIPSYILLFPTRAVTALSYDFLAKIGYLLVLFGPLALKPFSSIKQLIPTIPWFILSLFSNYVSYYSIFNQFPAYVIAFIFIAAVFSLRKKANLREMKKDLVVILLCSLTTFVIISPLSPVVSIVYPNQGLRTLTDHEVRLHQILTYIPQNSSVLTQSNIFPHVSNRINAYAIPIIHQIWIGKASQFLNFTGELLNKVEYILVDFNSDPISSRLVFSLMQENQQFKVFASADQIILFKKNYEGDALILSPYRATFTHNNFILYSGEVIEDSNSTSGSVMHFYGNSTISPMFWYGPRSILPPGTYNITLRLKVDSSKILSGEILTIEVCFNHGQTILISKNILHSDYSSSSKWFNKVIGVSLDYPLIDFEIRAVNITNQANVYLDYIDVVQIDS